MPPSIQIMTLETPICHPQLRAIPAAFRWVFTCASFRANLRPAPRGSHDRPVEL